MWSVRYRSAEFFLVRGSRHASLEKSKAVNLLTSAAVLKDEPHMEQPQHCRPVERTHMRRVVGRKSPEDGKKIASDGETPTPATGKQKSHKKIQAKRSEVREPEFNNFVRELTVFHLRPKTPQGI